MDSYQQALEVITPEFDIELHLEIVADLIKAFLVLGNYEAGKKWHEHGFGILRDLVNQVWAKQRATGVKRLQLKFILYYRFAFDFAAQDAIQNNNWANALVAAELDKNIPLTWLLSPVTDGGNISPSFAEMQTLVNQTTALIYWYYSSHSFTVFILTEHNLTALPFPATSLREMERLISAWQRYYQTNTTTKSPESFLTSKANWQELPAYFQAIATTLGMPQITQTIQEVNRQNNTQINQLILIPHRDLHRLPLEASFRQYWQQQYGQPTWYQNIAMTRLPSAAFGLKNSRNMRSNIANPTANNPTNLLLVAYANSAGLPRLQYSQTEATGIKSIWGKSPAKVREFADNSATYHNLKNALCQENNQENNQVFHFSGHGSYNQEQPNLSSLFLSGDDELTAGEIANLPLSSPPASPNQNSYALAYINACETGVTKMTDIETEYVGLVSAFLRAGVSQVISNLWPMNDEAAGLLAIKFYQFYLAGSPAAIALNQAKTWLQTATWADITQVYAELLESENATPNDKSILDKAKFRSEKQNPQDIPFQDACFWAGVVISG